MFKKVKFYFLLFNLLVLMCYVFIIFQIEYSFVFLRSSIITFVNMITSLYQLWFNILTTFGPDLIGA